MQTRTPISPVNIEDRKKLDLSSGDTVRVWVKVKEGDKSRLQSFEGLVLARKHGAESGATFTVRKVLDGVGVERIFPLYSPMIDRIEVLRRSKVRRSKLYYVREKAAKEIRHNMRKLLKRSSDERTDTKHAVEAPAEPQAEEKKEEAKA